MFAWPSPDTLIVTGRSYTFHQRTAASLPRGLVVGEGRLLTFIDADDRRSRRDLGAVTELDLSEFVAVPGFIDAHNHQPTAARDFFAEKTAHCNSLSELLACLRQGRQRTPPEHWITTEHSLTVSQLGMDRLPVAAELDEAVVDRPVAVRFGAHVMALNTEGLRRSGLTAYENDPPQGRIDRDPRGAPFGPIREYGALRHVLDKLPAPSAASRLDALERVQRDYASLGITTVRVPGLRYGELATYQQLRSRLGTLTTRIAGCLRIDPNMSQDEKLNSIGSSELRTGLGDDVLRVDALKLFVDGGIETTLTGTPHEFLTPGELSELVSSAVASGWSVACHATSSSSVDHVLDAYEHARRGRHTEPRLVLEHGFFATTQQLERMARLGVWYSTQIAALSIDAPLIASSGTATLSQGCPCASALRVGVRTVLGSDWNATPRTSSRPFAPMHSIAAAVARRSVYGDDLGPAEAVTPAQAFYLHTAAPAALIGNPRLGGLFPGAHADLAVLGSDPINATVEDLSAANVAVTIRSGHVVSI